MPATVQPRLKRFHAYNNDHAKHKIIAVNTACRRFAEEECHHNGVFWRFSEYLCILFIGTNLNYNVDFWKDEAPSLCKEIFFIQVQFKLHVDLNHVGQTRNIHPRIWQTPKQKYILNLIQPNPIQSNLRFTTKTYMERDKEIGTNKGPYQQ